MDIKQEFVPFDVKLPRRAPARADQPHCDCWDHPPQGEYSDPKQKFRPFDHWLKPEHWSVEIFASAPLAWKRGACMRICGENARIGHISLAEGQVGIDLPLLVDNPNDPSELAVYVQHGYCCTCDAFEWVLYSQNKLSSPIVWFTCGGKR